MLEYICNSAPSRSLSTCHFLIDKKGILQPASAPYYYATSFIREVPTFIDISTSKHHSIALSSNGEVYGYGTNTRGQLGPIKLLYNGKFSLLKLPILVVRVIAFKESNAVLDTDGNVWCRGGLVQPLQEWVKLSLPETVLDILKKDEHLFCVFDNIRTLEVKYALSL